MFERERNVSARTFIQRKYAQNLRAAVVLKQKQHSITYSIAVLHWP